MKYVCDLWLGSGYTNLASPYGYFIFDYEKFPTIGELGEVLINNLPLLQNDYVAGKKLALAAPSGKITNESHPVGISFKIEGKAYCLYCTNVRQAIEDKPIDKINLYT